MQKGLEFVGSGNFERDIFDYPGRYMYLEDVKGPFK